jgi:AraC-like DNA-binding protein
MRARNRASARARRPDAVERVENYYALNTAMRLHPELSYWIVRWNGKGTLRWMELNETADRVRPFHFEIHYGKQSRRDAYYDELLRRAVREGRLVVGELHGFSDLFYCVASDRSGHTLLYAGQFLTESLDWEGVARRWRELSGHAPASANPDFERFVRMALELPVLEPRVLQGIEEFLGFYAEFLLEPRPDSKLSRKVDRIRTDVFTKLWPSHDWALLALSSDKFHLTPWTLEGKLSDWMKEEMGICRLPTTALALMPVHPGYEPLDPLEALVRNRRIQQECLKLALDMPETGAAPLQDYAVSFLTSVAAGKNTTRARLELRERAQKLQAFVRDRFGLRAVVGVGRSVPPGAPLYASHREAVLALHLCVQLGEDVLFYDEKYAPGEDLRYAELQRSATALVEALAKVSAAEVKLASDRYVRGVLLYSDERMEVMRGQFLAMLFQLLGTVRKRHPLPQQRVERLAAELSRRLEEAHSVTEIIDSFNAALGRLLLFSSAALEGPKVMRLETTLAYLRENFAERLRLGQVARKSGFSVPAFSRVFKRATGTSFLAYLRAIRVDYAKQLLKDTALGLEQVAQACGFESPHHLIRSFKVVTGETPGNFRRVHAPEAS